MVAVAVAGLRPGLAVRDATQSASSVKALSHGNSLSSARLKRSTLLLLRGRLWRIRLCAMFLRPAATAPGLEDTPSQTQPPAGVRVPSVGHPGPPGVPQGKWTSGHASLVTWAHAGW